MLAGATGVYMERWSLGIALTWALFMPMVWLTRMDTGVVFCRKEDFVAIGGYDEQLVAGLREFSEYAWSDQSSLHLSFKYCFSCHPVIACCK